MASPALSFSLAVGQRVRVKSGDPPGHIRTPEYLRGREGVIERRQGAFRNPEEVAFGREGLPKQPLYLVRFAQTDVWPDYAGPEVDTISADIFEHWLDAIDT